MVHTIEHICRHQPTSANILIVSHWIAIKTAIAALEGLGIDDLPGIPKPDNGQFKIIEA